jgi:hypothetical protein
MFPTAPKAQMHPKRMLHQTGLAKPKYVPIEHNSNDDKFLIIYLIINYLSNLLIIAYIKLKVICT